MVSTCENLAEYILRKYETIYDFSKVDIFNGFTLEYSETKI